jgi:uncharacterized protein YggU (UPF0235/DUF167 family)
MIPDGMAYLQVRVTPGARETAIGAWRDGALQIKVRERADKGRANEAVIRLLARELGLPASAISLKRGSTSRDKLLAIEGVTEEHLQRKMGDVGG